METQLPSLDQALEMLRKITESESELTADTPFVECEIDSLDLLEFMFQAGINSDEILEREDLFDEIDTLTIAQLYERLTSALAQS
jgi:acyl carrier protein